MYCVSEIATPGHVGEDGDWNALQVADGNA